MRSETEKQTARKQCQYCGDEILDGVVPLDVQIIDPEDTMRTGYCARYELCSEECRDDARRDVDWMTDGSITRRDTVPESEANTGNPNHD